MFARIFPSEFLFRKVDTYYVSGIIELKKENNILVY